MDPDLRDSTQNIIDWVKCRLHLATAVLLTDTIDINDLDNTMCSYDICNNMNINFWNEIYNDLNINFWNGCLGFFDARFGGKRKKKITPP